MQSTVDKYGFPLKVAESWPISDPEADFRFELAGGRVDALYDYDRFESAFSDVDVFIEDEELDEGAERLLRAAVGNRTGCLNFVLAGEPEHAAVGFILSYCLVKDFGAVCFDADGLTSESVEPLSLEAIKSEVDFYMTDHFPTA